MRTKLKTNNNHIHLNLKKKWFDMIFSGDKKEEYRDIKPYYINLLIDKKPEFKNWDINDFIRELEYDGNELDIIKRVESIIFSNGFSKNRKQFEIKVNYIDITEGLLKYGAQQDKLYFNFGLGDIIQSNF